MDNATINTHIRRLYANNEPLDEASVKKNHPDFHQEVIHQNGSWKHTLRKNHIGKHQLIERQRFLSYCIMKRRFERFGEEALRPKNIDEETKCMITKAYKSIKELTKETLQTWTPDRIAYDFRLFLLTGGRVDGLLVHHPELHFHVVKVFGSIEELIQDYRARFGILLEKETTTKTFVAVDGGRTTRQERANGTDTGLDLDELQAIGYLSEEEAQSILESGLISEGDVTDYLMDKMVESRLKQVPLKESVIKEENPAMYHAIIERFGNLKKAVAVAVLQQVEAQ